MTEWKYNYPASTDGNNTECSNFKKVVKKCTKTNQNWKLTNCIKKKCSFWIWGQQHTSKTLEQDKVSNAKQESQISCNYLFSNRSSEWFAIQRAITKQEQKSLLVLRKTMISKDSPGQPHKCKIQKHHHLLWAKVLLHGAAVHECPVQMHSCT